MSVEKPKVALGKKIHARSGGSKGGARDAPPPSKFF